MKKSISRWSGWDALSGPHSTNHVGWLALLVLSMFNVVNFAPSDPDTPQGTWLMVGIIGWLSTGVFYFTGSFITKKITGVGSGKKRVCVLITLASFVLSGALRGVIISEFFDRIAGPEFADPIFWIVSSVGLSTVMFVVVAIITTGYVQQKNIRAQLEIELATESALKEKAQETIDEYRRQLITRTKVSLVAELDAISANGALDSEQSSTELKRIVVDVVRPLSYSLTRTTGESAFSHPPTSDNASPRYAIRQLLSSMLVSHPIAPVPATLIFLLLVSSTWTQLFGLINGIFNIAVATTALFLVLVTVKKLLDRDLFQSSKGARSFITVATWIFISVFMGVLRMLLSQESIPLASGFRAGFFLALVSVVLSSLVKTVAASWENARRQLEESIFATALQRSRISRQAWIEHRNLSQVVHNRVQAHMLSAAMQIAAAPDDDQKAVMEKLGTTINNLLNEPISKTTWREDLDSLADVWERSIDFRVVAEPDAAELLDREPDVGSCVSEVIRECTTNAVRAGNADSVCARVRVHDDIIQITVTDDGYGVSDPESVVSGLGSRMFDQVCVTWSLSHEPGLGGPVSKRSDRPGATFEGEIATAAAMGYYPKELISAHRTDPNVGLP